MIKRMYVIAVWLIGMILTGCGGGGGSHPPPVPPTPPPVIEDWPLDNGPGPPDMMTGSYVNRVLPSSGWRGYYRNTVNGKPFKQTYKTGGSDKNEVSGNKQNN